jgi:exonuclease SbcC
MVSESQIPMISSLHIENFQIHQDLKIDLGGITVLISDNDRGKSATIRALRWLLLNEWAGKADQMTTWDMDFTQVSARVDNRDLSRRKSSSENTYILDGQVFEAVGSGKVPTPISSFLNVTEENFQEQLDPAFWFHLTAGQVARSLNKIVALSSIDDSLDNVAKMLREAREEVKASQIRAEEAAGVKESLSWVPEANAGLKRLEEMAMSLEETQENIAVLERSIQNLEQHTRTTESGLDLIQGLGRIVEAGEEYQKQFEAVRELEFITVSLERKQSVAKERKEMLIKKEKEFRDLGLELCKACGGSGVVI